MSRLSASSSNASADAGGDGSHALLQEEHYSWAERLESLPRFAPFLAVIAIVMIALYGGWQATGDGTPMRRAVSTSRATRQARSGR